MSVRPDPSSQILSRASFAEQAYRAIRKLIVAGELPPGAALRIDGLSKRLGVSNSPIREALRWLEREGWVEAVAFRGMFVRPFDSEEFRELYEVREILEVAALRKAMPHPPAEVVTALEQCAGTTLRDAQLLSDAVHRVVTDRLRAGAVQTQVD